MQAIKSIDYDTALERWFATGREEIPSPTRSRALGDKHYSLGNAQGILAIYGQVVNIERPAADFHFLNVGVVRSGKQNVAVKVVQIDFSGHKPIFKQYDLELVARKKGKSWMAIANLLKNQYGCDVARTVRELPGVEEWIDEVRQKKQLERHQRAAQPHIAYAKRYLSKPDRERMHHIESVYTWALENLTNDFAAPLLARLGIVEDCIKWMLEKSSWLTVDALLKRYIRGDIEEFDVVWRDQIADDQAVEDNPLSQSLQSEGWNGPPLIDHRIYPKVEDGRRRLGTGSHRLVYLRYLHERNLLPNGFKVPVFDLWTHWEEFYDRWLLSEETHKRLEEIGEDGVLSHMHLKEWSRNSLFFTVVTGIDDF